MPVYVVYVGSQHLHGASQSSLTLGQSIWPLLLSYTPATWIWISYIHASTNKYLCTWTKINTKVFKIINRHMVLLFQSETFPHHKAFLFLEVIICHFVSLSKIISKWNYSLCTIVVRGLFHTELFTLGNYVFMYLLNFYNCWSYIYIPS